MPRRGPFLLSTARANPGNFRFTDLIALAEAAGFAHVTTSGSHRKYAREGVTEILEFQPRGDGMSKAYQVRQLVDVIDKYSLYLS